MGIYSERLQCYCEAIEQALPTFLPQESDKRGPLSRDMRYAFEGGGKRLRPVLMLEWAHLCGADPVKAIPFTCALEMIHSYSLVHDDLPCMDDSPMRRGKPSVHAAFGEDTALLAGDALLNRAFEICLAEQNHSDLSAQAVLRATAVLGKMAGFYGMIGGQAIDLQSEGQRIDLSELEQLQEGKTAALLRAACRMGAILGGASEELCRTADAYGRELGLCFQIVDDILDVTATAAQLGKPIGGDAQHEKSTYVSLLGLEAAQQLATSRTEAAVQALESLGGEADELRALTRALLSRGN